MKRKFILTVFLSCFSLSAFSKDKQIKIIKDNVPQICCVRTAANTRTGESVSVRACVDVSGDAVIDKGKACARAKDLAVRALATLDATPRN